MSTAAARAAILAIAFAAAAPAAACGHCIEDKVAAVYDYAIVTRAFDRDHRVAFFAIDGTLAAGDAAAVTALVGSARGVDKASVRVSAELASLSFAFDQRRASLAEVQKQVERRLKPKGLALLPLQVMEPPPAAGTRASAR
ncbi:MAG TPA: hypothetical protein VFV71_10995 [Burkholderiales bacterium]|nr:hypothetical protein [Burkholderiales bacterium]